MNTPNLYKNNNPRLQLTLAALLVLSLSANAASAAADDELEVTMEIISASSAGVRLLVTVN